MEDDKQQEFISWLADKLQAQDQTDLKKKLQGLGDEGIRKAYDQFTAEKSDVQSHKDGGRLSYVKCLQAYARGGAIEAAKCGCGGKMKDGGAVKPTISKDKGDRKEMMKGGKMKKHQYGGQVYSFNQNKGMLVTKDDGLEGQWGNNIKTQSSGNIMLNKSQVGINEITPQQLQHLQTNVPNFNQILGTSQARNPGEVQRYSPEQSDAIRQLLNRYPMPKAVPQQQPTNNMIVNQTGDLTARLKTGGRMESGKNSVTATHGIKKKFGSMKMVKSGDRSDVQTKEKSPGSKDWMDKGKVKEKHTAVTKVPKGAAGMAASTMGGMVADKKPKLVSKKKPGIFKEGGLLTPLEVLTKNISTKVTLISKKAKAGL